MAFLKGHFNYLRSIENPHGFQNAMENIQSQIGSPNGGVVIERTYQISPEHMDPDQLQENGEQMFEIRLGSDVLHMHLYDASSSINSSSIFERYFIQSATNCASH